MDNFKLGIFGDSYADLQPLDCINEAEGRRPWPITLGKLLKKEIIPMGVSATSTWFSYKNFLKEYKNTDTVVFCYSSNDRWHTINSDLGVAIIHHIISPDQMSYVHPDFMDVAKKLVDVHPYVFDPQLNLFVVQHVFNSVNDICRENNIKIVNILSFEELAGSPLTFDISKNAGTVLTNLAAISNEEYKELRNSKKYVDVYNKLTYSKDPRFCHLNPHNNTALAHIIKHCLENNVEYKNLLHDGRFSIEPEHLEYILNED